jgi:hypothetical protein
MILVKLEIDGTKDRATGRLHSHSKNITFYTVHNGVRNRWDERMGSEIVIRMQQPQTIC